MAYPYPTIDDSRTTERLSAFLSKIQEKKPVDHYFEAHPALEYLWNKKVVEPVGAQIYGNIGTGGSPNFKWMTDYDVIDSEGTNNAKGVVYNVVYAADNLVISKPEYIENAHDPLRIYNRMDFKRTTIVNTFMQEMSEAMFAAAQDTQKITSLAPAIDSTGSAGSLSQTDEATWASQETAHGDTFENGGYDTMLDMYNDLKKVGSMPEVIFTTYDIQQAIESSWDKDVRYGSPEGLKRGSKNYLLFKGIPIIPDADATAQTMYFLDCRRLGFKVSPLGNMKFDDMVVMQNAHVYSSKFLFGGQLVMFDRRSQGKITGIS